MPKPRTPLSRGSLLAPRAGRHEPKAGSQAYSAASGAQNALLYIPERSKQHARRWPEASLSHATTMRLARVSSFFAEVIQWIQSRRATGVMSSHTAFAAG